MVQKHDKVRPVCFEPSMRTSPLLDHRPRIYTNSRTVVEET